MYELIEDHGARDGAKDEHVEEDKDNEEGVDVDVLLNGRDLIIRIRIICPADIHYEYHLIYFTVAVLWRCRFLSLLYDL